ncbi:MAG: TonB-dependent receptor [Calditrichia bacterium]
MTLQIKGISLFFILIFTLLFSGFAQNTGIISGQVLDATTLQPLVGVNIEVINTSLGAATDTSGIFIIEKVPVGTRSLRFSYIGYETFVKTDILVTGARPARLTVKMRPAVIESEGVTVTAGYFINNVVPTPSLISLNREEIRRSPGGFEDIVRTVAGLPGVTINNAGGRNDLLVRGGGPAENLYVVNNIEVGNINHFGTQGTGSGSLSFVNLDFIEDASFSTGAFGAQYGNKLSSVLSLELTEGRKDRLGGKGLISATQYGLNLEGPVAGLGSFIFSARKSYLDLIFKSAGLPFVPVYTDFNLLATLQPSPKDRISILGLGAIDEVDRDLSSEKNRVINAGIMDNSQDQWISGVNYRRALDKGYLDLTVNYNYVLYKFGQADENLKPYFRSRATEATTGLKGQYYRRISPNLYLLSGASSQFLSNKNTTQFADTIYDRNGRQVARQLLGLPGELRENQQESQQAIFQEWEWTPRYGLTVNLGYRADYYGFLENAWYFSPRFSLKQLLSEKTSLKLSSGIYYQAPSLVWITNPANRRLKALQNWMSVLGTEIMLRKDTRLSFEVYYKRYRDLPTGIIPNRTDYLIITNAGGTFGGRDDDFQSFGFFDLISAGRGFAYGAEFYLQKKLSETPFYGQIGLSLSRSRYTPFNGKEYPGPFDQPLIFNIGGGYLYKNKWQFSGRFRFFSGTPYTPVYRPTENPIQPGFIQNLPGEYLSKRLKPGHHLDLRVDRLFNFKKWTLIVYLDVQNVYNYKIPIKPTYNFWEDKITESNALALLPSIGISANF